MADIAVLMDDIDGIKTYKDTTFALMLAAQALGHSVMIFTQRDWQVRDGEVFAYVQTVKLTDDNEDYYRVLNEEMIALGDVDVVLQRKDPLVPGHRDIQHPTLPVRARISGCVLVGLGRRGLLHRLRGTDLLCGLRFFRRWLHRVRLL